MQQHKRLNFSNRLGVSHKICLRVLGVLGLLLAFIVADILTVLPVSGVAYAEDLHHLTSSQPNAITDYCLQVGTSSFESNLDGTTYGVVENQCPVGVGNGFFQLKVESNCPGIGNKVAYATDGPFGIYVNGSHDSTFGEAFYCEICINHVGHYPPFTITFTSYATANFTYRGIFNFAKSNNYTETLYVTDNIGQNAPPCP